VPLRLSLGLEWVENAHRAVGDKESGSVHVAEEVAVAVPAPVVADYLSTSPRRWMRPLLALAWNEAEQSARRRSGDIAIHNSERTHALMIGERDERSTGTTFRFEWRIAHHGVLVQRLAGALLLAPLGTRSLIEIRGTYRSRPDAADGHFAMRPVEIAVRSLLGHVRAAIEDAERRERSIRAT
jgi:hypothetical protein